MVVQRVGLIFLQLLPNSCYLGQGAKIVITLAVQFLALLWLALAPVGPVICLRHNYLLLIRQARLLPAIC